VGAVESIIDAAADDDDLLFHCCNWKSFVADGSPFHS